MKIPDKIQIGGQEIVIVRIEEGLENNQLATICLPEGVIKLAKTFNNKSKKQSESSMVNSFIHECVHGILSTMGEIELSNNEKFVNTFAGFATELIKSIENANA